MNASMPRPRWAGLALGCVTGALACHSTLSRDAFPDAGMPLSAEGAQAIDRETCPDQFPLANTLPDAERIDRLAERCRQTAVASEAKLAAALDEVVASSGETAADGEQAQAGAGSGDARGDGGGGGGDIDGKEPPAGPSDVDAAAAKLRAARARLAAANEASNQATRRRDEISDRLYEARLWQFGFGAHAAAAAAAGDRTFSRVGGNVMLRVNPTFEVDFSITRERVIGLDFDKEWHTSGRAIGLIGRGGLALAIGAGSGLAAPDGAQRPLIAHLGLTLRPFSHMGCSEVLPITDLSLFAEYWHLDGNALRSSPPDSPVFFGLSATFGLGMARAGETRFLPLDGVTLGCKP